MTKVIMDLIADYEQQWEAYNRAVTKMFARRDGTGAGSYSFPPFEPRWKVRGMPQDIIDLYDTSRRKVTSAAPLKTVLTGRYQK